MSDDPLPRLSDLADALDSAAPGDDPAGQQPVLMLGGPTSRRAFLARASTLSLAIPGIGAALAACSSENRAEPRREEHHGGTSATGAATAGAGSVAFHRYAPELPPRPKGAVQELHWHAREAPIRIDESTVVAGWTFEGDIPGPIVHTRVGDTVHFTLTNDAEIPHSMDFHAAQVNPKEAFRSVAKGQSVSYSFSPKWAGAFLYHCGTAPVLMHIGSGMFGAIIVDPREGMPPAREFVLVQSEFYLADAVAGVRAFDYQKMLSTLPDFVCFNGRPNQYVTAPIRVKSGERVRFWVVNAGPTHSCHFHVVGEQFDSVYLAAPPASPLRGVQTWDVSPGGGMCFELLCDVPGEFPFVNHGFGHGQKGTIGILIVE